MLILTAVFIIAFSITFFLIPPLLNKMKNAGIISENMNQPNASKIPSMGGIAVIVGFLAAILAAIALNTYGLISFNLVNIMASLLTFLLIALIGIFDDIFSMRQYVKASLPLIAAIPLVAVSAAGSTSMFFPFIGNIDFGIFYFAILIPLGIAVCSNLTNMLAGFNGNEAGMGIVIFTTMLLVSISRGNIEIAVLSASMLGALLAFILFNWYPAKTFIGDIGTLAIGAVLACSVIIGNMETAGAILMIPYVIDFFIKLPHHFPKTFGGYKKGKLYAPKGKPKGLGHWIMKLSKGISERNLSLTLIAIEAVFGVIVLILYLRV